MSFLKRTMLYLIRKKGKTFILFLLIFIVSTFLISCFSLLYATKEVLADMRLTVGAAFHIYSSSVNISAEGTNTSSSKDAVITEKAVQEIMLNDNLKYYNGRNLGYAKGLQFMPGAYYTDENNMGKVVANNYSMLHLNFQNKILKLTEGRHITPNDKNVVLISETLASLNGLSVGDIVIFYPAELAQEGSDFINVLKDNKTTVKAELIGIFKEVEQQADAMYQPTAGLRSNLIFSDHAFLKNLGLSIEDEYTGGVSFYIQDPLYLNHIIDEVRQINSIDWNSFFISKDDWRYEKISSGIHTIQNLIKTLLICVSVVSAAVSILILIMRMRGRIHETGIMLSIGISKQEIIGQFIIEIIVVSAIAFVFSYFVAGYISVRVENIIIDNLNLVQINRYDFETGLMSNNSPNILLTMPFISTVLIYGYLLITIISSSFLSALAIVKLKPKEILSKMI